jgi:hypothetical protein
VNKRGHNLIIIIILFFILATAGSAFASKGYDLNTEITIKGTIVMSLEERSGPLTYVLESDDRTYQIITGPWWYLKEITLHLIKNMKVEVTGSKLYDRQGNLYLLLYSLKDLKNNKIYHFRDDTLEPLWKRRGQKRRP